MAVKIAIGSEHAGAEYRERLAEILKQQGDEVTEIAERDGLSGYPAVAEKTALLVTQKKVELGILICGTGIGMNMAAGKIPGIRAALCTDSYMGTMAKKHNNANVLVFGSRVVGFENMLHILETFRKESYEGGRHEKRLGALKNLEEKYLKGQEAEDVRKFVGDEGN